MLFAGSDALDPHAPPLPGRAVIRQRWSDFVFLHWRVSPEVVAPFMPPGTLPDVDANGDAWVGLIPFVLSDHADWPGLLRSVHDSGARQIYVTHGSAAPLARYLREVEGLAAEPLEGDFSAERGEAREQDLDSPLAPPEATPAGQAAAPAGTAGSPTV